MNKIVPSVLTKSMDAVHGLAKKSHRRVPGLGDCKKNSTQTSEIQLVRMESAPCSQQGMIEHSPPSRAMANRPKILKKLTSYTAVQCATFSFFAER